MRKTLLLSLIVTAALLTAACAAPDVTSKMSFYHGPKIPDQFFSLSRYTSEEVEIAVRLQLKGSYLYYILLDENDKPVSEGWFHAISFDTAFPLVMKAKKGVVYQEGKKYRLCIGNKGPEEVYITSSNYPCIADYEFILKYNP